MENISQSLEAQPIQPIEPIKNQNIFKYLFIVSIFVFLGIIIAFYLILSNQIKQLSNKQTTETTPVPTAEEILVNPTPTEIDNLKELTTAINPNNESNIEVSVSKVVGDYATGQVHDTNGGGAGWIAVKINGVWKKVAEGQDGVTCDIVDQYQIPKEIYGNCNKY